MVRQFVMEYFGFYSLSKQRFKMLFNNYFDALDEVPCPPQMEHETFLSQVDLEAPFQADLEMEADEFESNNNQNEPNENDPEPEKVHSIAETLLSLSNIRAHLMSLGEDTEAFDSLKKLESIFIKKNHRRISIQTSRYY